MLVVADASPINVLVCIQHIEILPRLFGSVVIPPAVRRELSHPNTPTQVREWVAAPPAWLAVRAARSIDDSLPVDMGEREAISLARELNADLLLVDDRKARRAAQGRGLRIAGTLGVLEAASARGLVDLRDSLARLRATSFTISARLLADALEREEQRMRQATAGPEQGDSKPTSPERNV